MSACMVLLSHFGGKTSPSSGFFQWISRRKKSIPTKKLMVGNLSDTGNPGQLPWTTKKSVDVKAQAKTLNFPIKRVSCKGGNFAPVSFKAKIVIVISKKR